jgi:hypothetical protein
MGQRGFPDAGYVFKEQMSSSQKTDDRHFNGGRFAFNHPRDIVLNRTNGFRRIHHDED